MMEKYKNLNSQKFHMLTPINCLDNKQNSYSIWRCKCDCGKYTNAKASDLIYGKRKSCGCLQGVKDPIKNFEKHFKKGNEDECWLWEAYKLPSGYGLFQISHGEYRQHWLAHRFSYVSYIDSTTLTDGDVICHSCDNPSCVNPDHLFKGTHQDNVNDKINKGRQLRGESVYNSKLTETDVRLIRKLLLKGDLTQTKIGTIFNVSGSVVTDIKKGRTWSHVK